MMEAPSTSEKSVNFYKTTWCNNPEDSHLHIETQCHAFVTTGKFIADLKTLHDWPCDGPTPRPRSHIKHRKKGSKNTGRKNSPARPTAQSRLQGQSTNTAQNTKIGQGLSHFLSLTYMDKSAGLFQFGLSF
jgi:hypothetical protein